MRTAEVGRRRILAERHQRSNAQARGELNRLIDQLGVKPGLLDTLAA